MSTNYPNSQDSYTVHQDGVGESVTAADVNNLQDAVVAIEQTLGTGTTKPTSSATASTMMTRDVNGQTALNALDIVGLTGAVAGGRFVGFIAAGPPTTGTFSANDLVIDVTNKTFWICTASGTPGTWVGWNSLRTDAGAPNPQRVTNAVSFNQGTIIGDSTNGFLRIANDTTGIYLEGVNGAQNSGIPIHLTGLGGQSVKIQTVSNVLDDGVTGAATFAGNVTAPSVNGTGTAQINYSGSPGTLAPSTSTTFTIATGLPASAKSFALSWTGIFGSTKGSGMVVGNGTNYQVYASVTTPWTIAGVSLSNGTLSITINNADATSYTQGTWTLNVWGMVL